MKSRHLTPVDIITLKPIENKKYILVSIMLVIAAVTNKYEYLLQKMF